MFRILLLDYYQMKVDEISRHFALARENNVDGVHDLRVALKRLKAFYNLVGAVGESFNAKKRFRPFKAIARNTGELRDAHVQLELLDETSKALKIDALAYRDFLSAIESEKFEHFTVFAETNPLETIVESGALIAEALEKTGIVRAETMAQGRFYNLRNNVVIAGGDEKKSETALHTVRILAKETHYTFEILQQCFGMFNERADFIAEIKKVHQTLGKWHDYEVFLGHLDDFFRQNGHNPADEPYKTLISHVRKEKGKLAKKFWTVVAPFSDVAMTL